MPAAFDPTEWFSVVASSPRGLAFLIGLGALSMLPLGLRAFRWYVGLAAAGAGYLGGAVLAELMFVRQAYVALPVALAAAAIAWWLARRLLPLAFVLVAAAIGGLLIVKVLGVRGDGYWLGVLAGGLFGLGLWLMASRFSTALFFAVVGTALVLASIGAVVRADSGPLAVGAVSRYPLGFTIAGIVLFLAAMVMQVVFDDYDTQDDASGVHG